MRESLAVLRIYSQIEFFPQRAGLSLLKRPRAFWVFDPGLVLHAYSAHAPNEYVCKGRILPFFRRAGGGPAR